MSATYTTAHGNAGSCNLLSGAREWTRVLIGTRQVPYHWATTGILPDQGFWWEASVLSEWSGLARRKGCLGDEPLWTIKGTWSLLQIHPEPQWLMLPLQGKTQMLLGRQMAEEDRGNQAGKELGRQRGKIIFFPPFSLPFLPSFLSLSSAKHVLCSFPECTVSRRKAGGAQRIRCKMWFL